jgi:hypothetical protein
MIGARGGRSTPRALAQLNLIKLMPHVACMKVYDSSAKAATDGTVPLLILVRGAPSGSS